MATTVNNNNIESKNNQEFFTKGKKYRCIKSVKGDFTKGKVYEQSSDPTQWYGYFRNDKGIHHVWPQPAQIDHSCELYDMKPEDIDPRLYFEPVEEIIQAEGVKVGDKVRHNKHEEVATVTAIREAFVNRCDGYRYLYTLDFGQSVKGPFDVELNGGEFLREAFTLCNPSEIKPKAAFQIGDRVERKSDGERGTVGGYDVTDGKLTYIVKYDRTQRRESDGFEYLSEELNGDELQADCIESRKRTIIARAKEDKQAWRLVKGCEVRVRKAYTNGSSDPENWTYCVSWYADGQLVECENGVRLEQAAKALNDLPQWAEARKAA